MKFKAIFFDFLIFLLSLCLVSCSEHEGGRELAALLFPPLRLSLDGTVDGMKISAELMLCESSSALRDFELRFSYPETLDGLTVRRAGGLTVAELSGVSTCGPLADGLSIIGRIFEPPRDISEVSAEREGEITVFTLGELRYYASGGLLFRISGRCDGRVLELNISNGGVC